MTRASYAITVVVVKTGAAYVVILTSPGVAWLLWISTIEGRAGDVATLAWATTVAGAAVFAGSLCRQRWYHVIALTLLGAASAVETLYLWWSSEYEDGLFMVGLALVAPLALAFYPFLIKSGMWVAWRRRKHGASHEALDSRRPGRPDKRWPMKGTG